MSPHRVTTCRRAFTLIELGVSTAMTGVLLLSLASVLVIASKALPEAAGATESAGINASALDQMLSELRCAGTVTEATAAAITFTVPDRDSDGNPESIRYSWAGAGHALMRSYNGAAAAAITTVLQDFKLTYDKRKKSTTQNTTKIEDSGEVLFASFNGWSGLLAGSAAYGLTSSAWCAEAFPLDKVSFPPDTSKITITRVQVQARRPTTPAGTTYSVAIHQPTSPGGVTPSVVSVGTPATMSVSALGTSSWAWIDANFTDVTFTQPPAKLLIVLKGSATSSASVRYLTLSTGLVDSYNFRTSSNSGTSWSTVNDLYDMPFFVYGRYERPVTSNTTTDTFNLAAVEVRLQPSTELDSAMDSGVETLNKPPVPGP